GFANITATIVPWLVTGGTLELSDALAEAPRTGTSDADVTVLPGPLVVPFVEAGRLDASRGVVLSVWRAPERRPQNSTWPYAARLVDVLAFGEAGLVALRRLPDGGPAPLLPGPVHDTSGFSAISLRLSERGTLLVDGPMSPIEGKADAGLDTGIPCVMRTDGTLAVTGPPRGVVSVGGHRVAIDRLREALAGAAPDAVVAALPDRLTGQRLAASGLGSVEGHPLLNDAFRDRRP
ncbi:MAG: hypothetical protein J0H62_11025, partial [Rhizobiales bacterium]|nr:hypothetical protein [Hyphomicrobiales bacterium]